MSTLNRALPIVLIFLSAVASYPSAASAGIVMTSNGPRYAPQHRWWRDDGRKQPQRPSQPQQAEQPQQPQRPKESQQPELSRSRRADRADRADRDPRDANLGIGPLSDPCNFYEVQFVGRHGLDKPDGLALYNGCTLHRRDHDFHAAIDSARSTLINAISALLPSR